MVVGDSFRHVLGNVVSTSACTLYKMDDRSFPHVLIVLPCNLVVFIGPLYYVKKNYITRDVQTKRRVPKPIKKLSSA